ncbi:MAG: tetratricopeptide repeat protein [Pseudomonadota bacterium]
MAMGYDVRGHHVRSQSPEAIAAFDRGIHSFACWRTDTFAHLDAAIEADPDFALARLAQGWILHTARTDAFRPKIEAILQACAPLVDRGDERECAYFDGLQAAFRGYGIEAGTVLESMLLNHPRDLFAHRLVQFELFWNGRAHWMRDIVERSAGEWNASVSDYGCFLSVRAFSNEESGFYEQAERYGREAVEIDPTDCWGTHAVAHVLVMQGRIDEGVNWLEGLSRHWADANQMRHHLWWHLCLFLLEREEHDRIVELLTTEIRNPESPLVKAVPDATIDIQNVASLLMRLELRGVDVSAHWPMLADVCAGRVSNHANAFSNAHDMMILAANGEFELADQLLLSMRERHESPDRSLAVSYSAAGIAACEAVLAHRKRDYAIVIERLAPVRHDLPLIGGSHAQRDIFFQLLIDAAMHQQRDDLVSLFLDDVTRIGFDRVRDRTLYRAA